MYAWVYISPSSPLDFISSATISVQVHCKIDSIFSGPSRAERLISFFSLSCCNTSEKLTGKVTTRQSWILFSYILLINSESAYIVFPTQKWQIWIIELGNYSSYSGEIKRVLSHSQTSSVFSIIPCFWKKEHWIFPNMLKKAKEASHIFDVAVLNVQNTY